LDHLLLGYDGGIDNLIEMALENRQIVGRHPSEEQSPRVLGDNPSEAFGHLLATLFVVGHGCKRLSSGDPCLLYRLRTESVVLQTSAADRLGDIRKKRRDLRRLDLVANHPGASN